MRLSHYAFSGGIIPAKSRELCSHSCLPTSCMSPVDFEIIYLLSLSLGNAVIRYLNIIRNAWLIRLKCFNEESCRKAIFCACCTKVPCRKTRVASVILLILGANLFGGTTMSRTSCLLGLKNPRSLKSLMIFYIFVPNFSFRFKFLDSRCVMDQEGFESDHLFDKWCCIYLDAWISKSMATKTGTLDANGLYIHRKIHPVGVFKSLFYLHIFMNSNNSSFRCSVWFP